jgi:hypothetical protein
MKCGDPSHGGTGDGVYCEYFYFLLYVVRESILITKNRCRDFDGFARPEPPEYEKVVSECRLSMCMYPSLSPERLDGLCSHSVSNSRSVIRRCPVSI